jgi:prolyl 4-hydroxylase
MLSLLNQSSFTDNFIYLSKVSDKAVKQILNVWKKDHKLYGTTGKIGYGKYKPHVKKSIDISVLPKHFDNAFPLYMKELNTLVRQYTFKYHELHTNTRHLAITEPINIQKYEKGDGFFLPHYERSGYDSLSRVLVFMTYLSTNPGCGTYFKYQDAATDAIKGHTVIWPAEFTHVHNGLVDFNKEKYIATGWINMVPPPEKENPLPGKK